MGNNNAYCNLTLYKAYFYTTKENKKYAQRSKDSVGRGQPALPEGSFNRIFRFSVYFLFFGSSYDPSYCIQDLVVFAEKEVFVIRLYIYFYWYHSI